MEKTTLGLIVALGAAVAAPAVAQASAPTTDRILNPTSVAELLDPVADPVATLDALQSQRQLEAVETDGVQVAEDMHHHHHHMMMMHRHHHHHHFFMVHHHHHHHHHHMY